ncbi:putative kinesin heavy chain isoform [Hordeum vulgare]|nr:putative kinesin heavy chain isoform [Hordeum vulgare]
MEKDVEIHKLKAVVDQLKFIHVAQGNYIRKMKHNHLKEKENMSTGNMTLKWCWTDLKKDKEKLDLCIGELMKEKEKWSIEKSAMECCIAHVKKVGENNKRKLKEIKGAEVEILGLLIAAGADGATLGVGGAVLLAMDDSRAVVAGLEANASTLLFSCS